MDWCKREEAMRPVLECITALEEANDTPEPTKFISMTDPAASWTAAPGGPAFFAYSTNYLIDTAHGVILDVEATPANRTADERAPN